VGDIRLALAGGFGGLNEHGLHNSQIQSLNAIYL
jgi:hypothetical protein